MSGIKCFCGRRWEVFMQMNKCGRQRYYDMKKIIDLYTKENDIEAYDI